METRQARLRFDSDTQSMYCTYCIEAGVEPEKSHLVKGCTNIKFKSIKSHQLSNFHLYSTKKHLHDQNPKEAPALRAHLDLDKSVTDKLKILFCTVHALNIKAHPLTDYKYITEMDVKKGWKFQVIGTNLLILAKNSCKSLQMWEWKK